MSSPIDFYTTRFGFTLRSSAAPAFADVVRGPAVATVRPRQLGGPSHARRRHPVAGGWNRIHLSSTTSTPK
jgi:hypothetical protein